MNDQKIRFIREYRKLHRSIHKQIRKERKYKIKPSQLIPSLAKKLGKENIDEEFFLVNSIHDTLIRSLAYFIFTDHQETPAFDQYQGLFSNREKGYVLDIPTTIYNKKDNQAQIFIPKERIREIYQKLVKGRKFGLKRGDITPEILHRAYEACLIEGQQDLQKGVFYSPKYEVRFIILLGIFRRFQNEQTKPSEGKLESSRESGIGKLFQYLHGIITKETPKTQADTKEQRNQSFSPEIKENNDLVKSFLTTLEGMRFLDPACGTGMFLVELLGFLISLGRYSLSKKSQLDHYFKNFPELIGIDVNPTSIEVLKLRLRGVITQNTKSRKYQQLIKEKITLLSSDYLIAHQTLRTTLNLGDQGIDIVVGNPPYLRNRDIFDPYRAGKLANTKYRQSVRNSLSEIPCLRKYGNKRLDYSLYFLLHSYWDLKPNGLVCFIMSNSWMNVKYGYDIQEFLVERAYIPFVFESRKRSFKNAQINTINIFLQKAEKLDFNYEDMGLKKLKGGRDRFGFVKLNKDYKTSLKSMPRWLPELSQNINQKTEISDLKKEEKADILLNHFQSIRYLGVSRQRLENFRKKNWGNYFFNAPSFYFKLLNQLGDKVVYLKEVAKIRRGMTTNCNKYFILTRIPGKENLYENGYGDQFPLESESLMPFLKTPKQMEKPRIEDNNFTTYLFYTGKAKGQLKKEGLQKTLNYVKYGEHKQIKVRRGSMKGKKVEGVIELASFQKKFERSPDSWYCLQNNRLEMEKGEKGILIQKIFNSNYKLGFFSDALMPNNTFYFIRIRKKFSEDSEIILALLMSSLTMLCIELEGRTNFGGGALDTATFDIKNIILPRPSIFETQEKNKLKKAAQRLYSTKFGDLEKEIGKEARKDIDSLIFAKINGQKKWNNEEFYGALKNIQKSRTEKRKFR